MTDGKRRDLRDPVELRRVRDQRARERLGRPGSGLRGGLVVLVSFAVVVLVGTSIVATAGLTVLRPIVRAAVVGWAGDNPSALGVPFVAELVREDLGDALTEAVSSDASQVGFTVSGGENASDIAERLESEGLIRDGRAFVYLAVQQGVEGQLEAGDYVLRRNMTPNQLVGSLLLAQAPAVTILFREGLRLEQMTAKLETLPLQLDPAEFYRLASAPTPGLLAQVPWLVLPKGASLEGYLWADTYRVLADTSAEELIVMILNRFREVVGEERMTVPEARGLTFHQVVTLASVVEQEVIVADEAPLVAGVYQNRLAKKMLLQADPTLHYATDTLALAKLPVADWVSYVFWKPLEATYAEVKFPKALRGFQTYQNVGLIPGPICTPSLAALDAALEPNTKTGYLYFVARTDGSKAHAFAKTYAEHLANLKKYGYQ